MSLFDLRSRYYDRSVFHLDPKRLAQHLRRLKSEQHYLFGFCAGPIGAAIASGAGCLLFFMILKLWIATSGFQFMFVGEFVAFVMFVGVGLVVGAITGSAIRHAGRGVGVLFGIYGAVLSLASSMIAFVAAICWLANQPFSIGFDASNFLAIAFTSAEALSLLTREEETILSFLPFATFAFALLAGYKISFRQLDAVALMKLRATPQEPATA